MRICFVLPALTAGGAERVLITLMNNLDRSRFDPVFLTVSDHGSLRYLINPNIPFHSLHTEKIPRALPKLFLKLKELQPHIVVSTMAHMNFWLLLLKPFLPRTKFIVREATKPTSFFNSNALTAFIIKAGYRLLYPLADCVICPSRIIIDEFRSILGMSCTNHALLYNPVDVLTVCDENARFDPTNERKKTVHFIAAGRLHVQKGFDRLIEYLPSMKHPHDWALSILGEGIEQENLERLIRDRKLEGKVFLLGLIKDPWTYYAEADCLLTPSRVEGLPNVVLESLACGTPVIAMKEAGGIEEIANLAPTGAVTIANTMDMFIDAMQKIKPDPPRKPRPSLLPKNFHKEIVEEQFTRILENVLIVNK